MKKIILSALILSLVIGVQAQEIPERKHDGNRPHHMQGQMKHHPGMDMQKLNLTEDQKAKFKSEKESFQKQMEELKKKDNIMVKEWRSKMETLRKEHKAKMQSFLTSEQKAQLEKMKEERQANHQDMMKKRGEMMKKHLGLTDEQSAKMEKSRIEVMEKTKVIRENKSLTDEQKKEQIKELHKMQQENMKSILSEEQLNKMKEVRKKEPGMHHKNSENKEVI